MARQWHVVLVLTVMIIVPAVCLDKRRSTSKVGEIDAGECLPTCEWECDSAACPAKCTPQCERPDCEIDCAPIPQPDCKIECTRPQCQIRCSNTECADGGCPVCENVCLQPKCETKCAIKDPPCTPKCGKPECNWDCVKPSSCSKPKCELKCSKKNCKHKESECCPCDNHESISKAVSLASVGESLSSGEVPSFVEIAHHHRFMSQNGNQHKIHGHHNKQQCCPCTN